MAKKILFWSLLPVLSALLLVAVELLLAAAGYGEAYRLNRRVTRHGRDYLQIDRHFPTKYFAGLPRSQKPQFRERLVPVVKQPNTVRIVALGGSTTFGFPYPYNLDFPSILGFLLKRADPAIDWQVVNLATSAINSYAVAEIAERALEIEPDLFLIYMGHNEFYGALGAASTIQAPGGNALTRLYIRMKEFKSFQAVAALVSSLTPSSLEVSKDDTLMSLVVKEQTIAKDSPLFQRTIAQFRDNLERIARLAGRYRVPVVIGTPVSNLKDHPPFIPILPDPAQDKDDVLERFRRAPRPEQWLDRYLEGDPGSALAYYMKGMQALAAGDTATAYAAFFEAREQDGLRFRAPAAVSEVIRAAAGAHAGFTFVDLEAVFRAEAAGGVPGADLFLEHLHPNVKGNYHLAASFAAPILAAHGSSAAGRIPGYENFLKEYAVTPLDRQIARISVMQLTAGWPFRKTRQEISFTPGNLAETLAWNFSLHSIGWSEAVQQCLDAAAAAGDHDLAARYARSLRLADPYQLGGYLLEARELASMDDWDGVSDVLDDVPFDPVESAYYRLAIAALRNRGRVGEVADVCRRGIAALAAADPPPAAADLEELYVERVRSLFITGRFADAEAARAEAPAAVQNSARLRELFAEDDR